MSLTLKIYRALISPKVRVMVRSLENLCEEKMPVVHKKFFVPVKSFLKAGLSLLLKFSMSSHKNSSNAENLWRLSVKENFAPLVSVVVPNFNHASFLRKRLESIYNQTYQNFEVLLLDDASTDNSRDILQEFYNRWQKNTRLIFNEKNSGGVFQQWRKGILAARGDLIWIAESDDFCTENLLAELVPAFADDAIQLAFCRTDFIKDDRKVFSTEQYLFDLPAFDLTKNFAMTAAAFVEQGFAIKNIIPNVSGVIFRRRKNFPEQCLQMKLCGDWLFYLHVIKGGCVYYSPVATNFYRVHKNSSSLKIQKEPRYFLEHERIAEFIAQNYSVPTEVHERHLQKLEEHFFDYYGGKDLNELTKLFDLKKILSLKRKPNILMGVFAFSVGGGEIFPLILANELNYRGYPVTVLDFQMEKDLPPIRRKLNSDVPLLYINETAGLAEVVKKFKIDLIHTHHGFVEEAVSYFTENNPNLLHIVTLHGMYEEAEKIYLQNLLGRVKKSVNAFVYIADKNLIPFRENNFGHEEIFYKIGNGLEREPINPVSRSQLGIPEDSFVACVVSRAIVQKGWQAAIEVVKLANTSGRRIDLILVGAGELYDKLKNTVPEYVHMVGFRSNVRDYLAAADIGLLPSEYVGESFPLLIIDSLFAGRPVVSSNLGEIAEMIEDAGIVFDLVQGKVPIEELARILRELADNPAAYEKIRSHVESVAEKFSIARVAEKYINLYEEKFL